MSIERRLAAGRISKKFSHLSLDLCVSVLNRISVDTEAAPLRSGCMFWRVAQLTDWMWKRRGRLAPGWREGNDCGQGFEGWEVIWVGKPSAGERWRQVSDRNSDSLAGASGVGDAC